MENFITDKSNVLIDLLENTHEKKRQLKIGYFFSNEEINGLKFEI